MIERAAATRARGSASTWLLCLLVLAAAAAAWWYLAPDTLPGVLRQALPASQKSSPTLYKWRDANGSLHVTDVAPPNRPYEVVRYDPNANVVPSMTAPGTPAPKHD